MKRYLYVRSLRLKQPMYRHTIHSLSLCIHSTPNESLHTDIKRISKYEHLYLNFFREKQTFTKQNLILQ
jgi:hypothetical protein